MPRFSPSDAALEGFRLTRERPLAVLIWAAVRLVYGVLAAALLYGAGGADFTAMMALVNSSSHPDPAKLMPLVAHMAPVLTLMIPLGLAFYAVLYAAVLRAVLAPGDSRFGYLRLSMQEARQFGLALIVFVLFMVYAFVLEVVSVLLILAVNGLGQAALPVQILIVAALAAAFVYPAVRLSLAPAATFVEGRIALFRTLPLTKGQFWRIAGAYGLALILVVVVWLLASVAFVFVVGAIGMAQHGVGDLSAVVGMTRSGDMSPAALLKPAVLIRTVFGALLTTLLYVLMAAPGPAIFRDLTGRAVQVPPTEQAGKPWG